MLRLGLVRVLGYVAPIATEKRSNIRIGRLTRSVECGSLVVGRLFLLWCLARKGHFQILPLFKLLESTFAMRLIGCVVTLLMILDETEDVVRVILGMRQTPLQKNSCLWQRQCRGFFYISGAVLTEIGAPRRPSACAGATLAKTGARNGRGPTRIYLLGNNVRSAIERH